VHDDAIRLEMYSNSKKLTGNGEGQIQGYIFYAIECMFYPAKNHTDPLIILIDFHGYQIHKFNCNPEIETSPNLQQKS